MAGKSHIALYALPVESNPAYSAKIALELVRTSVTKAERTLAPRFWRKLLGGTSRDHARAVIAAMNEEVKAARNVITAVKHNEARKGQTPLGGSLERLLKLIDLWRDQALAFEEAIYGTDEKLLSTTRRLMTLCNDLRDPAAGIY